MGGLVLLGLGNVGRALARLLLEKQADLPLELPVVGILTARHGGALDRNGLDLTAALELVERGSSLAGLSQAAVSNSLPEFLRACGAQVLVETTPVNYQTGQPALGYLQTALECGLHAVTANKGPVVHGYRQLRRLAQERGRWFLFESAVMDGAPVFSLWRETLPAARLTALRGVLNSTTNLILTLMEQGRSFQEAVAHAQALGIAETDPRGDTEGWDAAVKVAALVTVLMDAPLLPQQVEREGIERISPAQVREASQRGERWKLICRAERREGEITASVRPERVGPQDPLFGVMGTSSAITLWTDVLGPLTLVENDPGPRTTAYGLLADLIRALSPRVWIRPARARPAAP
jgi:homoserine dehydrogenase